MKTFWKDKKVMITGGLGFIGSHLAEKLLKFDADVTIIDLPGVSTKNVESVEDKLNIIYCDVSDIKEVKKINEKFDTIFHLAASASPSFCEKNQEIAFRNNVIGTFNMLKYSFDNKVKKFIFPSSAQLYDSPKYLPIDEKHSVEFLDNYYTLTKKMGEDLCNIFNKKYGLPIIFLRLFNTFGPRQSSDYFMPTLILQGLNKKVVELWNDKPTRDFVFVDDTVRALMMAAESNFCGGPINIGTGRETKVGDIANQVAEKLNVKINFLNKEVVGAPRLCCNNSLAKEILKWEPKTSLEDGIKITIKWYEDNLNKYNL
jgi:nucleoside-diphosphate-sugar epimerase